MTSLMICATVRTAPFLGGSVELFERKNSPVAGCLLTMALWWVVKMFFVG